MLTAIEYKIVDTLQDHLAGYPLTITTRLLTTSPRLMVLAAVESWSQMLEYTPDLVSDEELRHLIATIQRQTVNYRPGVTYTALRDLLALAGEEQRKRINTDLRADDDYDQWLDGFWHGNADQWDDNKDDWLAGIDF